MTSPITTHNFGQMQHAEYEAQAARNFGSAITPNENKPGLIVGKIAALVQQLYTPAVYAENEATAASI